MSPRVIGRGPPTTVSLPGVTAASYHHEIEELLGQDLATQGTRKTELFYYAAGTTTPGLLSKVKVTDGTGAISTLILPDKAGRPLSSTTCTLNATETACASEAVKTDFGWDFEGNLKSVTPPGKAAHNQTFTPINLLESYVPPTPTDWDGSDPKTSFFYSRDGELEYVRQPGNTYVDYVYDPATRQLIQDGNAQFSYYTASGAGATKGRLQSAQTATGSLSFTYDGPLLTSQTSTWTNASASVNRGYNNDLRTLSEGVTATVNGNGGAVSATTATYGYDVDGLLTCASLASCAAGTTSNKLSLSYNGTTGALTGTSFSKGSLVVSDAFGMNTYGELASYSAKVGTVPFYSVTYDGISANQRDGFGRVKRETDNLTGDYRDYTYDEQGRLSYVKLNGGVLWHYTYDGNGNRLSTSGLFTTPIAVYDAQDRLRSYDGFAYRYGPNGELRARPNPDGSVAELTYSPLGHLSTVLLGSGGGVDYSYDGLGRRIERRAGATVTRYVYRDGLTPAAVLDGGGTLLARFVYASRPNVPDLMVLADGTTTFRIISDQRGSPRVIVDTATGTIVEKLDYDEFGNRTLVTNTGAFPTRAMPFGFAGGLYDEDTGLVHFGARDYDPVVGRWVSKDPILFGGGQGNLYVYVVNDPINRSDRNGKWGVTDLIGLYWGLSGWAAGGDAPSIRFDPSAGAGFAIEFTNNPAQGDAGYSTTFGNVICYAGSPSPNTVKHELAHTRQYASLGDSYLPAHIESQLLSRILTGNYSDANVLEVGPYSPEHKAWPWGNWP